MKESRTLKTHIHPLVGIINICFSQLGILQFHVRPLVNILEAVRAQNSASSGFSTCQRLFDSLPIPAAPGQDSVAFLPRKGGDEHSIDSMFSHTYFDSKPASCNFNHNIKLVLQLVPLH